MTDTHDAQARASEFVMVPREPTEAWAYSLANQRQGQSSTPRCEPPGQYEINRARRDIKDVLAAAPPLASTPGEEVERLRAKPLFWRKSTDHPQDDGQWVADGISGRYSAEKQRDGSWVLWWAHDNFIWEACADFAEVKSKAESDWQRRFADRVRRGPCIEDGGFVGPLLTSRIQDAQTIAALTPSSERGAMEPGRCEIGLNDPLAKALRPKPETIEALRHADEQNAVGLAALKDTLVGSASSPSIEAAALERAAKVAEQPHNNLPSHENESPCQWQRRCTAAAIRALKPSNNGSGE